MVSQRPFLAPTRVLLSQSKLVVLFFHVLIGDCNTCQQGRLHLPCNNLCNRTLFCGHVCQYTHACVLPCPPCSEPCNVCERKCGLPCKVFESDDVQSSYYREHCKDTYKRQTCDKPCQEQLPCGHVCVGICGEPCPKFCRICNKDAVEFGEAEGEALFVELVDCGHVFNVKTLDQKMAEPDFEGGLKELKHRRCSRCNIPVFHSRRYGNIVADFNVVKCRILSSNVVSKPQIQSIKKQLKKLEAIETKEHAQEIERSLAKSDSVAFQHVSKLQNQVTFLTFFDRLILKYNITSDLNQELYERVNFLIKRIMLPRVCFSEQEVKEISEELSRTKLLVCLECLMTALRDRAVTLNPDDSSNVHSIRSTLTSGKAIGKYNLRSQSNVL